ncbi:MAG: hypothetical protein Q9194_002817 [Teloschistes cf. exilis]
MEQTCGPGHFNPDQFLHGPALDFKPFLLSVAVRAVTLIEFRHHWLLVKHLHYWFFPTTFTPYFIRLS